MPTFVTALIASAVFSTAHAPVCQRTFSEPMITRAIDAAYSGTRDVTRADRGNLRRFIRCARPDVSKARMWRYWHQAERAWKQRRDPPMVTQLASWYYDGGNTACGWHAGYGVANKWLRCGTKVLFRYHGRSVTAMVDDRGPYISGRVWDLNQATAGALGFGGVDYVQSSVAG
jgi:rare lipoprotein A (peptidoglycan hydrolase)